VVGGGNGKVSLKFGLATAKSFELKSTGTRQPESVVKEFKVKQIL